MLGVLFDVQFIEIRKLYIIEFCSAAKCGEINDGVKCIERGFFSFLSHERSCNSSRFGTSYM